MRTPAFLSLAVVMIAAGICRGGPLVPPPGPVAATMKPIGDVEPRILVSAATTPGTAASVFFISAPGSYYLGANIVGVPGKHGIEIGASGVSLDLNGFYLTGVPGSLNGVEATAPVVDLSVANGVIRAWGGHGIRYESGPGEFEHLHLTQNGGVGIAADGASLIRHCTASGNGSDGMQVGSGSHVLHCSSRGNAGTGLFASGLGGIAVSNCILSHNTFSGLFALANITVTDTTASSNGDHGIELRSGSTAMRCVTNNNGLDGIHVPMGMTNIIVESCSAGANTGNGIQIAATSTVRGCNCGHNGAAGIRVSTSGNRIEANNVASNSQGIVVVQAGNIVIRNSARNHPLGDYSLVAGTAAGPILNAADLLTSSNPHANYSY